MEKVTVGLPFKKLNDKRKSIGGEKRSSQSWKLSLAICWWLLYPFYCSDSFIFNVLRWGRVAHVKILIARSQKEERDDSGEREEELDQGQSKEWELPLDGSQKRLRPREKELSAAQCGRQRVKGILGWKIFYLRYFTLYFIVFYLRYCWCLQYHIYIRTHSFYRSEDKDLAYNWKLLYTETENNWEKSECTLFWQVCIYLLYLSFKIKLCFVSKYKLRNKLLNFSRPASLKTIFKFVFPFVH